MRSRSYPITSWVGVLAVSGLLIGLAKLPSTGLVEGAAPRTGSAADLQEYSGWGDSPDGLDDFDARGAVSPNHLQRRAASTLDADIRWNRFGTPSSIYALGGSLGQGGRDGAVDDARRWLRDHHELFGLTAPQVEALDLVSNQDLVDGGGNAVLLQQKFGDVSPALSSMVTVGVSHNNVVYISSSLARTAATDVDPAQLTPTQGWLAAAKSVGFPSLASDITKKTQDFAGDDTSWTRLDVAGLAQEQQVRLRALANADGIVRPVYEANVVHVEGGSASAYTLMVDAATGEILHRANQVEHAAGVEQGTPGGLAAAEGRHAYPG